MSIDSEHQERVLAEALDLLELPAEELDHPEAVREWLAVFALLPHGLEPVAPSAELRQDLLDRISSRDSSTSGDQKVLPLRRAEPNPAPASTTTGTALVPPAPVAVSSFQRWTPALAAGLVVCLLGVVLFLGVQNRGQQQTIDSLVAKLDNRADQRIKLEQMRFQLADFEQRFNMITTVAAGLYPLRSPRPVADEDSLVPRGVMYVCSNHQQWYLHLQNLEPSPEGQAYFLWFLTDEGPVEMESFRVENFGQPVQLRRPSMPAHTRGVMVSLQPLGEHPQPTGAVVLRGDRSVKL